MAQEKVSIIPNYNAAVAAIETMVDEGTWDWEVDNFRTLWAVTQESGIRLHPMSALAGWLLGIDPFLCPASIYADKLGLSPGDRDRFNMAIGDVTSTDGKKFVRDVFPPSFILKAGKQ